MLTCCHLGGGGAGRLLQQGVTAGEGESEGEMSEGGVSNQTDAGEGWVGEVQ